VTRGFLRVAVEGLGDSVDEREYGLLMLVVSRCVERIGDHAQRSSVRRDLGR
jgi:phosphate uptake regulator